MNRYPTEALPRLHMGCGESLHSQLLLGTPRPHVREEVSSIRRKSTNAKTVRGRTRG